jgi:hypothetical protein
MGALHQDGLADETFGRNITLTSTLTLKEDQKYKRLKLGGGQDYDRSSD